MNENKKQRALERRARKERKQKLVLASLMGLGGVLLLAAALLSLRPWEGRVAGASGAPALQVDREQIDLGNIQVDQMVEASFNVTNAGDAPLRFLEPPYIEVREGCCPPVPSIGAMELQPGESTRVSMTFTMHAGMDGPHDFRVHLLTDSPSEPEKELVVLSNWVP